MHEKKKQTKHGDWTPVGPQGLYASALWVTWSTASHECRTNSGRQGPRWRSTSYLTHRGHLGVSISVSASPPENLPTSETPSGASGGNGVNQTQPLPSSCPPTRGQTEPLHAVCFAVGTGQAHLKDPANVDPEMKRIPFAREPIKHVPPRTRWLPKGRSTEQHGVTRKVSLDL